MNKIEFYMILESALLSFDGLIEEELVNKYEIDKRFAKIGVKLKDYLKSIDLK